MQIKITKPSKLLDKQGKLMQKGYATYPLLKYRRRNVARKLRLKEWDYYLIYNDQYAVAMTVGRSLSILLISATVIDLISEKRITKNIIKFVSKEKFSMPESSVQGNLHYQDKDVNITILNHNGNRELYFYMKSFCNDKDLNICIDLTQEPKDSMVIATPFKEDENDFYYNRKVIGMRASGTVLLDNKMITFNSTQSFALLVWGRGVWPYKTTWYWSVGQGMVNGNLFGFNLGYGFGDTSAATENMLFLNGIANKLTDVTFHIPINEKKEYDYLKSWIITSSDRRIEMVFTPILDRSAVLSMIVLSTNQHQVFGKFTGTAILDDGTIILLNDFFGFAERVENRW